MSAEPVPGRPVPGTYRIVTWDAETFRHRVDQLIAIYIAAMRYPGGTEKLRRPLWLEHSRRSDFTCVVAVDEAAEPVGLCYGYRGTPDQWWFTEVGRGMTATQRVDWMADYVELTELHVDPRVQGGGLGEAMLRAFLGARSQSVVLLSTPEGDNRAWKLYRRLDFQDVLRHYHFAGDPRPFAVLGRSLPLPAPRSASPHRPGLPAGPAQEL